MELAQKEQVRDEKINGVIYDMSPAPHFRHGIVISIRSLNRDSKIAYVLFR